MKQNRSIGYNYLMNTILQGSAYILPLIVNPYVSNILGPAGMGKISYVTAILSYFTMVAVLGVPTYGIREVAKTKNSRNLLSGTVYGIVSINVVMGIVVYAAFFFAVFRFPLFEPYKKLLLLMSPVIMLNLIGFEWLYKGLEKFSVISARAVLVKFATIILIYIMVHSANDIYIYGILTIVAAYGSSLWNFFDHCKYVDIRNMRGFGIKKHIKPILIFFGMTIATTIYTQMDMVMLGFVRGDYETGIYDAAAKIKIVGLGAVSSLGAVLLPRVTSLIAQKHMNEFKRVSGKALHLVIIFSNSLAIYVGIIAQSLIYIFASKEFQAAIPILRILTPTFVLIGMTNIIGIQMLVPLGRERMVLISEISGAAINLIFNAFLIPQYGAIGAAIGTLSAEITVWGVQVYACRDYVLSILHESEIQKILVAGILSGMIAWKFYEIFDLPWTSCICTAFIFYFLYSGILLLLKDKECLWIVQKICKYAKKET